LVGQFRLAREFKIPEYYAPQELVPGSTNQLKSLLLAAEAYPNPDGRTYLVKQARIHTFRPDGQTNVMAAAPECNVDSDRRTASSPGRLEVTSGDGRFYLEGEGFFCRMTNANLFLSNRVLMLIRKDVAKVETPSK
jgi:hypothetical protein